MFLTIAIILEILLMIFCAIIFSYQKNELNEKRKIIEVYRNKKNEALNENLKLQEQAEVLNKLVQEKESENMELNNTISKQDDNIKELRKTLSICRRKITNLEKKINKKEQK